MLKVWMDKLKSYENFSFCPNTKFLRFNNGNVEVEIDGQPSFINSDINIFALGGGSWAKTGSDGMWTQALCR